MSTADKPNNLSDTGVESSLGLRLCASYRWIVWVFASCRSFTASNDTRVLNAHQMRDLGLDEHKDCLTTQQQRLETARFNAVLISMGIKRR